MHVCLEMIKLMLEAGLKSQLHFTAVTNPSLDLNGLLQVLQRAS